MHTLTVFYTEFPSATLHSSAYTEMTGDLQVHLLIPLLPETIQKLQAVVFPIFSCLSGGGEPCHQRTHPCVVISRSLLRLQSAQGMRCQIIPVSAGIGNDVKSLRVTLPLPPGPVIHCHVGPSPCMGYTKGFSCHCRFFSNPGHLQHRPALAVAQKLASGHSLRSAALAELLRC